MRTMRGLVTVAAAVVLTSCSGDDGAEESVDRGNGHEEHTAGPLAGLSGNELCAMVDRGTIEEQFHESVPNALGGLNRPDRSDSVVCTYVTDSLLEAEIEDVDGALAVGVKVRVAGDDVTSAQEVLDAYFVDFDDEPVEYEHVDDLGVVAGYANGGDDVRLGGNHLVAILEVEGALVEAITTAEPGGSIEQLRPMADELVAGVEQELG